MTTQSFSDGWLLILLRESATLNKHNAKVTRDT